MAYGEVYEGTGEELAARIAALGARRIRVEVLDPGFQSPKPYDPSLLERNEEVLKRIFKNAPPLPDRSFTAEDFYD